jgi:hypothetical protein
MGFLILGLLGYFVLRRVMPTATFYSVMTADCKIMVILLLVASLVTGIASRIPVADVDLFLLCFVFAVTVSASYWQSEDDEHRSFPFLASLASRAPPVF